MTETQRKKLKKFFDDNDHIKRSIVCKILNISQQNLSHYLKGNCNAPKNFYDDCAKVVHTLSCDQFKMAQTLQK